MVKTVIIAGASGLIGSELIKLLLENKNIDKVIALVRNQLPINNVKLTQIKADFNNLQNYTEEIKGDALYCCLGTTKNKTPDKDKYRQVDFQYPLELAKIASNNKVRQLHLISALGADAGSSIFYNKLKGELEQEVKRLDFKSVHIYQPSLLVGNRGESRPLEKAAISFMKVLNPLLNGKLKKYRSIKAIDIAKAMVNETFKNPEGLHIYPSDQIKNKA